jgi:hypothetical protein
MSVHHPVRYRDGTMGVVVHRHRGWVSLDRTLSSVSSRWTGTEVCRNYTTTALPPSCPQDASGVVGQTQSEDCLFAVIYAPPTATYGSELPVFVW